jgi:drug/metabolite transporter (DMT)-like permease
MPVIFEGLTSAKQPIDFLVGVSLLWGAAACIGYNSIRRLRYATAVTVFYTVALALLKSGLDAWFYTLQEYKDPFHFWHDVFTWVLVLTLIFMGCRYLLKMRETDG